VTTEIRVEVRGPRAVGSGSISGGSGDDGSDGGGCRLRINGGSNSNGDWRWGNDSELYGGWL